MIGKPDDYVLETSKLSAGIVARQNAGFDTDHDGKITAGEFRAYCRSRFGDDTDTSVSPNLNGAATPIVSDAGTVSATSLQRGRPVSG